MRLLFLSLISVLFLHAGVLPASITPQKFIDTYGKVKILDQKELNYKSIKGVKFTELSDLAYHRKTGILYFVGDKGMLYSFRTDFSEKIDTFMPLDAKVLKRKSGKNFRSWQRDSEGLTLDGKGRLLISFEGDKPKIAWFHKNSKAQGNLIQKYRLPKILKEGKNYRSKNKSLEALAWHKQYGILTAAEWPLKKDGKKRQTIYALSGKKWHFEAEPEEKSAVVALETMDDGNILVLERSFISLFDPLVITLKKVKLKNCQNKLCNTEVLLKMSNHKGWGIDNFEGLARVGKDRYVMVSDDNDNFYQKTLLVYFEVK
jgi:hypothetical protein